MILSITETLGTRASGDPENLTSYDSRPPYTFNHLKTCRQIHSETHLLPFKLNTFSISSATTLYAWLPKPVLRYQLQSIRTLRIYTVKGLVGKAGGLRYLVSTLPQFVGLRAAEVARPRIGRSILRIVARGIRSSMHGKYPYPIVRLRVLRRFSTQLLRR
jgi:hypothetical protein